MKSQVQIKTKANEVYNAAMNGIAVYKTNNASYIENARNSSDKVKSVGDIILGIESVINYQCFDFPKYISKIFVSDTDVTVRLRSKLKTRSKYSNEITVSIESDFVEAVGKFYVDCLYEMYLIEEAWNNVDELNATLHKIYEDNNCKRRFEFVVEPTSSAIITYIDNEVVKFNASVSQAHQIGNFGIMLQGNEYNDFIRESSIAKLVEAINTIQSTAQFIKSDISIINDVIGIKTKKRTVKLIRGAYHRQARYLDKVKSGYGYYNEDVTINGETVNVFAIVEKTEDGTLSVVLNPFDSKTMLNVDFDVLAAVKEQMAS